MENVVDALKMTAAVLVFVIAIASSFSLFGTAKHTADSIITMRDKQAYLDSADLDGGILYTSTINIKGEKEELTEEEKQEVASIGGVTRNGDRIVSVEDIVSTIYRYSKEKYGVTIVDKDKKTVLARFDSNTEQVMSVWNNIESGLDEYIDELGKNTETSYAKPYISKEKLEKLYKITIPGSSITCGAPWYGNEKEIQRRIACDLSGKTYEKNGQKYEGKGLLSKLKEAKTIVEVTNEIDRSTYLKDKNAEGKEIITNLIQQYEMPTIEVVYIILN